MPVDPARVPVRPALFVMQSRRFRPPLTPTGMIAVGAALALATALAALYSAKPPDVRHIRALRAEPPPQRKAA